MQLARLNNSYFLLKTWGKQENGDKKCHNYVPSSPALAHQSDGIPSEVPVTVAYGITTFNGV